VQDAECAGYGTDTFLVCVMFARLSEFRSVLQGLVSELLPNQKCHNVYVHMGPICNGFLSNWSVAAHFIRDGVNITRNSHIWDRDNPHGTAECNYQHRFSVNVWCGVTADELLGPNLIPQLLTGYLRQHFARLTASTLREWSSTNTTTDVVLAWWSLISVRSSGSIWIINAQTEGLVVVVHKIDHHRHWIWTH